MKYPSEMDLDARLNTPSFIKIGSCVQKLLEGILPQAHKHTETAR
jgi:hypothetical protein